MALISSVAKILGGQGLTKLAKLFREIPEGLVGKPRTAAELEAVSRQYQNISTPAKRQLARITRDALAFNDRIMEGGKNRAGLRSGIPIAEGLQFNDANSAAIRYSVAVDIFDPGSGIRKYITPNVLSNKALTLDELTNIINERIAEGFGGSPGLQKIMKTSNPQVEEIHRVLAIRNS